MSDVEVDAYLREFELAAYSHHPAFQMCGFESGLVKFAQSLGRAVATPSRSFLSPPRQRQVPLETIVFGVSRSRSERREQQIEIKIRVGPK